MIIRNLPELKNRATVLTLAGDATVQEAAELMMDRNHTAVLITEGEKNDLKGIFTQNDLMNRVVAKDKVPSEVKLQDVMSKKPDTVTLDTQVYEAMQMMDAGKYHHMPVLGSDDHIAGMLEARDFVAYNFGEAMDRAAETARAAISVKYQPFLIILAAVVYTLFVIGAVQYWTGM